MEKLEKSFQEQQNEGKKMIKESELLDLERKEDIRQILMESPLFHKFFSEEEIEEIVKELIGRIIERRRKEKKE
jgi:uncharacterized membrane-anchored protein